MTLGIDHSNLANSYYWDKVRKFNNANLANPYNLAQTSASPVVSYDVYESSKGNTCTDGKDDGKVGLFSAIGNTVEGAGKTIVNMAKGAISHPFKTAAMIGACCIPVVGPVIAGGLATYGLYKGATTVMNGVSVALNATSDAEAKDAWENIGEGTLTAGVSAVGLKASAGALKSQVTGGSTTVNALKNAKANGAKAGDLAKTAVEQGIKETTSNIGKVAEAGINKANQAIEKGKQYVNSAKEGNLAQTMSDDVANLATKAGDKAQKTVESAQKKYNNAKQRVKNETKAQQEAYIDSLKAKGAKEVKGGYELVEGNLTTKYNTKGEIVEMTEVKGDMTTIIDKNGDIKRVLVDDEGTITNTSTTNKGINKTKITGTEDIDGVEVIDYEKNITVNNNTGIHSTETKYIGTDGKITKTKVAGIGEKANFTGIKVKNGKTTWFENGQELLNPTVMTKARIKYKATNAGVKIDSFIEKPIKIGGREISQEIIGTAGAVMLENQE